MTSRTTGVVQGTWPQKAIPARETVVYLDSSPESRTQTASELDSELAEHTVETPSEPEVVLERIESDVVCCFVCDPDTEHWNIVELLERIRHLDSTLPVVLYTGREERIAESIAAGATNYLHRTGRGASTALVALVSRVAENYQGQKREQLETRRCLSVLEQLPEAVFVTDRDGTFTWVCPNSEHAFAYSSAEIAEMGTVENLFEEKVGELRTVEGNEVTELQTAITAPDGEKREVLVTAQPISVLDGNILYTIRNLSERVGYGQQLAGLHATTKKLMDAQRVEALGKIVCDTIEDVLDISAGGVAQYEQDVDGFVPLALTPGLRELFDGEPNVLPDGSLPERVLEQEENLVFEDVSELSLPELAGTDVSDRPQFGMRLDDRTVLGITADESGALDQQTLELARILGEQAAIALDRIEREQELELFRSLMDQSTDAVFVEDPETGEILDVNETACRQLGYSRDVLVGMAVPDIEANLDSRDEYQNFVAKLRERDESPFDGVLRRKDGTTFPVAVNAAYVTLDEEHEYVLAIARDVTEQRRRERELQRSKEFLEKTQEIATIGGWDYDSRSDCLRWTDEVYRIHALDDEFDPTVEETLECYHEHDRQQITDAFEQLRTAGEPYDLELRIVRPDGEVRWVRSQGEPWYENGEMSGARGTFQDITERKERDRERRQNKAVLEKAQAVGSIGWWKKEIPSDTITWSEQVREMWGAEDDRTVIDHETFLRFVHPDDRAYVDEQWQAAKDGAGYDVEHRVITGSGELKWMREKADISFDENGSPASAIGLAQDITALKEQEHAFKQQKETLQELHEATQQLLTVEDESGLVASLADQLDDVFDLSTVGVLRFDEQAGRLVVDDETTSMSVFSSGRSAVEPGDNFIWEAYRTGETAPVVSGCEGTALGELHDDITAVLAVPLGGLGVVLAATTDTDGFPETTVEALEILATNTEAVFDRMRERQESARLSEKIQSHRSRVAELERVMETFQRIQRNLSNADSRDAFEQTVTEELAAMATPTFVWLGHPRTTDTDLSTAAWAGQDNGYLDSLQVSDDEQTPAQRAAAQRQVVNIASISRHAQHESWARTALACGFESAISLPIMYDDVLYGVLTAYAGDTGAFDELVLELFEDLVSLLGNSVSLLGQQLALSDHEWVEIEFELTSAQYPLQQVATETGATIRFDTVLQTTDATVRLLVTVVDGEPERVLETVTQNSRVREADRFGDEQSRRVSLTVDRPFLATKIQAHGGELVETVSENGMTVIRLQLPSKLSFRPLIEALSEQYPEMELLSQRTKVSRGRQTPTRLQELLTERQLEILTAAYHGGYYETPRGVSGEQIADNFDISGPVVYNHLQAAHRAILEETFET